MNIALPGHQKLIAINDEPLYLQGDFVGAPEQELEAKSFVQGGPRTQIYYMGYKVVKGSISLPMTINSDGDIDPAIKELLLSAEYPMRTTTIKTNYVLSRYGITVDDTGFGEYQRLAFENVGITELSIQVPNNGASIITAEFIAMIASNEAGVVPNPSVSGMMRRAVTYADCDVSLGNPEYHWDTSRSITLKIQNKIDPIVVLRSYVSETDQPEALAMATSEVWGTVVYSVDRGTIYDEQGGLPSGGYIGTDMVFDFSGVVIATFPHVIMKLTEQPLKGTDLIERTSRFLVAFDSTALTETEYGHFIEFPIAT